MVKNNRNQNITGLLIDHGKNFIVIHCHGYGAGTSMDSKTGVSLQKELNKNSISFCRFNFSGFGDSEGQMNDLTISKAIADLDAVIQKLKEIGFEKIALSGSSFGGGMVLNYAALHPEIIAVVTKAPVSCYFELSDNILEGAERSLDFITDANKYIVYSIAAKINQPVLVIHGDKDEVVPLNQSEKTSKLIKNCKLIVVKDGNHKLADNLDLYSREVANFFKEHKND